MFLIKGHGEWEMGNEEWGVENKELKMGNGKLFFLH